MEEHSAIHRLGSLGSLAVLLDMALRALVHSQGRDQEQVVHLVDGCKVGMGQLGPGQDMAEGFRSSCRMPSVS